MVLAGDSGRVECRFQFLFSGVWNTGGVEEVLAGVPPDVVPQWEDSCFVVHSPLWHSPGKSEGKSESCTFHCSKPLHLAGWWGEGGRGAGWKGPETRTEVCFGPDSGSDARGSSFPAPRIHAQLLAGGSVPFLHWRWLGLLALSSVHYIGRWPRGNARNGILFRVSLAGVDLQVVWWAHSLWQDRHEDSLLGWQHKPAVPEGANYGVHLVLEDFQGRFLPWAIFVRSPECGGPPDG